LKAITYIALLAGILAPGLHIGAQEVDGDPGYRIVGNRVIVSRASEWGAWAAAPGIRLISPDGLVRPRLIRDQLNAVSNAGEFMRVGVEQDTIYGGISSAGTRFESAVNVIDGDLATYWEPASDVPVEDWFVEIDLGRSVVVRRIIVRFVAEGEGDPFLKFRVMISDGRPVFGSQRGLKFVRVAQVNKRNKDQREFVFEIEPQQPVPEGVEGEVAQFLRVDVLESDTVRGAEVSREIYENELEADDIGAVDYFRLTVSGREVPVLSREIYETLPVQEQGPVRYYRRERPRLAEVEVETLGDNIIALTQTELFRNQDTFSDLLKRQLTDGLQSSSFALRVYDALKKRNQLDIDLGAKYWLDRIRLLSPQDPPIAYQIRVSDGSVDPNGERVWRVFDERLNLEGFLVMEERFPIREVRFVELRRLELVSAFNEDATLSEVQAYGTGYVSEVEMTSPLIRLGSQRIFSTIDWDAEAPPGTRVEVRTRSGDDLRREEHYYDRFGREIGKERWDNLINQSNRGPVTVEEFPGPQWSNWSEIYAESGLPFKSPSPRQFAQIQVRLRSVEPLRAAFLRRLELNLVPPLVERILAEITPVRGVAPGDEREFTLYARPEFSPGDLGFDGIVLRASSSSQLQLVEARVGTDAQLRLGAGQTLWPGPATLEVQGPGRLALTLPAPVRGGSRVYSLRFRTGVFLNSTSFNAEFTNSARPDVVQPASPGDASALAGSQRLVVVSDLEKAPIIDEVTLTPAVFSPNGDGVNDRAEIAFAVFRLDGTRRLQVEVFDLGGRRVRDLSVRRQQPAGRHRFFWDGRDEEGRLVPPGVYVLRLLVQADAGAADRGRTKLIHVAY
jgi:hypothetical protein